MTQITVTCWRLKIPTCILQTPPRPKFSSVLLYDETFSIYSQFLEKCTEWPQIILTCSRLKIPTSMLHTPPRPKSTSVSLYDEPFLSYGPIYGKVHRMNANYLDMFKVKNTNMHATSTSEAEIVVRIVVWWTVFELCPFFRKSALNDPKWPWYVKDKKHTCYIQSPRPKFPPISLYDEPIFELRPNFWKSALNESK